MLDTLFRKEALEAYAERWLGETFTSFRVPGLPFLSRKRRKVPVVLQFEASECGLACLAMILGSYGRPSDVRALREAFPTSARGVTLRRLIEIAREVDLIARPLRVELEYVLEMQLPCMLHWGLAHYVVLVAVEKDFCIIHDPALGRRRVSRAQFSRHFTGVALEFEPASHPRALMSQQRLTWRSFFGAVKGAAVSVATICVSAFLLEGLQILAPFYLQWTVDKVISPRDLEMRTTLLFAFLAVVLVQGFVSIVRSVALLQLGSKVYLTWLRNVFGHALKLPLGFFERRYLGDLMGRFEGISYIQRSFTGSFLEGFLDGLMSLSFLTIMYIYNPRLAAVTTATIVCAICVRRTLLESLRESLRAYENSHAKQQGYFLETVKSIQNIKQFCAEGLRLAQWSNLIAQGHSKHVKAEKIQMLFRSSNSLLFGCERIFVIWYATGLVLQHSMSVGMLFSYVMFRELLIGRINALLDKYMEAKAAGIHLDRLSDLVFALPESDGVNGSLPSVGTMVQRLVFTDLWFRFSDDDPWILKGASGVLEGEDTIAITGRSGSGKSTLIKLLQGLLVPTKGGITFNGMPLSAGLKSYRRMVAAVNQDDGLFIGTIAENISFFDAPYDLERIRLAAQKACIAGDIEAMPMKYDTLITDTGLSLSGGQKQRLLLARALYKECKLLFLDEATSHLDTKTEEAILSTLRELPLMRIIVAHRPETIAACSSVLNLECGVFCT
jgi:ATP-binding cassette subfamily B protein RaxB